MSCLAWNCCRLKNLHAEEEFEELIRAQDPLIIFLLENWFEKKQLEKIRCNVKYVGLFTVPRQSKGGELALLWKSDISMWVDSFSKYHIDVVVNDGSTEVWCFTGFYDELDMNEREEAWCMLYILHEKLHLPWCCMGDICLGAIWAISMSFYTWRRRGVGE